jgi:putative sigma-54 modulation protein
MGKKQVIEKQDFEIVIVGRSVQVTEAIKQYAREKIMKMAKLSDRIIECTCTIDVQKLEHRVDIILKVEHTKFKVSGRSESMYASIDQATDRLGKQLRRYRRWVTEHHAKGLPIIDLNVNVIEPPEEETLNTINEDIEFANQMKAEELLRPHKVVSREKKALKILTTEDAIWKMDASQDHFMAYRSETDRKLRLIYRRNDGNYGIIELE